MVVIKLPYRHTIKTDARTLCYVLLPNGTELKPAYEKRSRTGAHGEDVYDIDKFVYIIEYNRSGSGRESIDVYQVDKNGERLHIPSYPPIVVEFLDMLYPEWRYF